MLLVSRRALGFTGMTTLRNRFVAALTVPSDAATVRLLRWPAAFETALLLPRRPPPTDVATKTPRRRNTRLMMCVVIIGVPVLAAGLLLGRAVESFASSRQIETVLACIVLLGSAAVGIAACTGYLRHPRWWPARVEAIGGDRESLRARFGPGWIVLERWGYYARNTSGHARPAVAATRSLAFADDNDLVVFASVHSSAPQIREKYRAAGFDDVTDGQWVPASLRVFRHRRSRVSVLVRSVCARR